MGPRPAETTLALQFMALLWFLGPRISR